MALTIDIFNFQIGFDLKSIKGLFDHFIKFIKTLNFFSFFFSNTKKIKVLEISIRN